MLFLCLFVFLWENIELFYGKFVYLFKKKKLRFFPFELFCVSFPCLCCNLFHFWVRFCPVAVILDGGCFSAVLLREGAATLVLFSYVITLEYMWDFLLLVWAVHLYLYVGIFSSLMLCLLSLIAFNRLVVYFCNNSAPCGNKHLWV